MKSHISAVLVLGNLDLSKSEGRDSALRRGPAYKEKYIATRPGPAKVNNPIIRRRYPRLRSVNCVIALRSRNEK